jgi:hypothetical protein
MIDNVSGVMHRFSVLMSKPWFKPVFWILFLALFYQSGLAFTILLLEPENFEGGLQWGWAVLFPLLLPGYFYLNHRFGCAFGSCAVKGSQVPQGQQQAPADKKPGAGSFQL